MATPESIITAIHARLDVISGTPIAWGIGDKERQRLRVPPLVVWLDAPSKTLPARHAGGNPEFIARDVAGFRVAIWADSPDGVIASREAVRALFDNLRIAARSAPEAQRCVHFGAYEISPDAYASRGHLITTEVTIELSLTAVPTPVAVLDEVTVGGYVDDELVHSGSYDLTT